MTITLNELRKKYEELGAMIKSFENQTEQEEAKFPDHGDTYYYIDSDGEIISSICTETNYDIAVIANGNAFRTNEEAEFEREFRKVKHEMERCGGVYKTKRKDGKEYYLRYEAYPNNSEVAVAINSYPHKDSLPYIWFPTEEAAQKAIDTIGKERLLKYWFCVEV